MTLKEVAYTPQELKERWKDAETSFPLLQFVPIVVFQFCAGIFPLIAIDYGMYLIYQKYQMMFFWKVILGPILFLINTIGYIYFSTIFCALYTKRLNKISPPEEGTFTRTFKKGGIESKKVHYYHIRGLLYKWPIWYAKKSIIPWSVSYVLRELGENKIHKDAWLGDTFVGLEYTEFDEGSVMQVANVASSHEVNSIFGSLNVYKIKFAKNVVLGANVVVGPGAEITQEGTHASAKTVITKGWKMSKALEGSKYLTGIPPRRAEHGKKSVLEFIPEEFIKKTTVHKRNRGVSSRSRKGIVLKGSNNPTAA